MPTDPRDRAERAAELLRPFRALYPFTPRFLDVPGGALAYAREGDPALPPLLCVHGNPSWSILFRHVLQDWSGELCAIAPDHLGCGLSDQPEDWGYRLADHIDNLERLVLALDLSRITLLVHDWGGPIGLGVAVRHPERFARIVIANTAVLPGGRLPWRIALCRGRHLGRALVEGQNAFARGATHLAVAHRMPAPVRRAYVAPYAPPRSARATWRFVDDIPLAPSHPSWSTLRSVAAGLPALLGRPALLLWGARDWCFRPNHRDDLARSLGGAPCETLPAAGHYLFEDDPDGVHAALRRFFDQHPLPAP